MAKKKKEKTEKKGGLSKDTISAEEVQSRIMKALRVSTKKSLNTKQIASRIQSNTTDDILDKALTELVKTQKLEVITEHKYKLYITEESYQGRYDLGKDGVARVMIEELGQEATILTNGSEKAFNGDIVKVKIIESTKTSLKARVIEIIERKRTRFAGTIDQNSSNTYFIPQDNKIKTDFSIAPKDLKGAKHGDKVIVELLKWKTDRPIGKVIEVLGSGGNHSAEMNAIMMEFGLIDVFPQDVQDEANAFVKTIPSSEIKKRRDFRDILTLTIDPVDAKDFDDAISYQVLDNGNIEIGVHIADVTYYLKEGSALDREAYERATSVYLVDRVVPMLPEVLSNNLCSLVPNQDRLTYSAVFEMNHDGEIVNEWFGRTVIHSDRRFSYEEVQDILDKQEGEYVTELKDLNRIAYILREDRFAKGSINFETEEVKFKLDANGNPVEVFRKVRKDSHKLIEDFMLLANRSVAKFVAKKKKINIIPYVYRVHPTPDLEKLNKLNGLIKNFGYAVDLKSDKSISKSLNDLVVKVENTPEQNMIQTAAIRSMPKAVYTSNNIGHYGLGFKYYTHFTSPIRRYPDVLAHRILDMVLNKKTKNIDAEHLEQMCKHASDKERLAAEAERASIKFKQVEFMGTHIGKILDGVISGVTQWGLYVEVDGSHCEGMIPLREIRDDHYSLDETGFRLVGNQSGRVFSLGDRVRIQVSKTNLLKRQIDFLLIGKISELEKSKHSNGKFQKSKEILSLGDPKEKATSHSSNVSRGNNDRRNNNSNSPRRNEGGKDIARNPKAPSSPSSNLPKNSTPNPNNKGRNNNPRQSNRPTNKDTNFSDSKETKPDLSWKEDEKLPF